MVRVLIDIALGAVLVLAGYWMGRVDGWHKGSSDTAAYIANNREKPIDPRHLDPHRGDNPYHFPGAT